MGGSGKNRATWGNRGAPGTNVRETPWAARSFRRSALYAAASRRRVLLKYIASADSIQDHGMAVLPVFSLAVCPG